MKNTPVVIFGIGALIKGAAILFGSYCAGDFIGWCLGPIHRALNYKGR